MTTIKADPRACDANPQSGGEPGQRRALLVEDDPDQRKLFAWMLRSLGWDVVEAQSGVELLEWISKATSTPERMFDVVVSDIMMPDMTTIEVLSAWRYGGWSVPFIAVTAHDDPAIRIQSRALGATCVLRKPVQVPDLQRALERALAPDGAADDDGSS